MNQDRIQAMRECRSQMQGTVRVPSMGGGSWRDVEVAIDR